MGRRRCLAALTSAHCGHCPTSAPVAREPPGSSLTWISLLMGGLCLPAVGAATAEGLRGPSPAVFPGNPTLWKLQGGLQAPELLLGNKYLPPCPAPGGHLPPASSPASLGREPSETQVSIPAPPLRTLPGSCRPWGSTSFSACSRLGVARALPIYLSRPVSLPTPSHLPDSRRGQLGASCQTLCQALHTNIRESHSYISIY